MPHLMEGEPRSRSVNFTPQEKQVLTSLIEQYPYILNTKDCDNVSISAKHISWNDVYNKFCESFPSHPPRDIKQLKGCWKRLKMKRRLGIYDESLAASSPTIVSALKASPYKSDSLSPPIKTPGQSIVESHCLLEVPESKPEMSIGIISENGQQVESADKILAREYLPKSNTTITVSSENIDNNVETRTVVPVVNGYDTTDHSNRHEHRCGSKRKSYSPRRLAVRPARSYLQPPTTDLTLVSSGREAALFRMTQREHQAKMRIFCLKEWKLRQECLSLKIGLPPDYFPEYDTDDEYIDNL